MSVIVGMIRAGVTQALEGLLPGNIDNLECWTSAYNPYVQTTAGILVPSTPSLGERENSKERSATWGWIPEGVVFPRTPEPKE